MIKESTLTPYWKLAREAAIGACLCIGLTSIKSATAFAEEPKAAAARQADQPKPDAPKADAPKPGAPKLDAARQRINASRRGQRAIRQTGASDNFVGPPIAGAKPAVAPVKPGAEIPKPTVVLKPGEVPGVKFDTPVYDAGKVRGGTPLEHDYWFTNTGTGPLEILRVKPSCGCTVAGQYDKVVKPGETGKIPIKVNAGASTGAISKSITINTNAPGPEAQITLQIKGEVWQAVQVTPSSAAFGRITSAQADAGSSRKLTLVNNVEGELKPGTPTSSSPQFKAELTPLEGGKKYELTITMVPPLKAGNNSGKIDITTGLKDTPTVSVPVYAFVTAAVDVTPVNLTLTPARAAELTRQFYIRSNVDKPIKISELKSTSPDLKLELSDVKDAKTYRLAVTIPPAYKPTAGVDQITFNTDDPSVPQITIPISEIAPMRPPVTAKTGNPAMARDRMAAKAAAIKAAAGTPGSEARQPAEASKPETTVAKPQAEQKPVAAQKKDEKPTGK